MARKTVREILDILAVSENADCHEDIVNSEEAAEEFIYEVSDFDDYEEENDEE